MAKRERPIIESWPMVRAILEGRKTQARRVVKKYGNIWRFPHQGEVRVSFMCDEGIGWACSETEFLAHCPYGVPGDRLWVREKHQHTTDARGTGVIVYAADDAARFLLATDGGEGDLCGVGSNADRGRCLPIDRWRPSIHMPRWASRITLEVVAVRVERLQAISDADARAEGYADRAAFLAGEWAKSLEGNPWVWVVEFKRVDAKGGTNGEA